MMQRIILLTGPPGAGKGTQAQILASNNDWLTFSVGELLRNSQDENIKEAINRGDLLSAEQIDDLVIKEVVKHHSTVIVDGFPRKLDQAKGFDQLVKVNGLDLPILIYLHIDEEESWRRISDRGRKDDDRDIWQRRWDEYRSQTVPAVEYYREKDRLLDIDGSKSINEVNKQIQEALDAA
ncbi:MAG: nucleoside monophosphate kinase [Candidatus Saccharimonadales bacterium]